MSAENNGKIPKGLAKIARDHLESSGARMLIDFLLEVIRDEEIPVRFRVEAIRILMRRALPLV